jgi:chemotaxis protein CheD
MPGDIVVTSDTMVLSTILGSCVSVCLFDPTKRISGMNHYLLPVNAHNDRELLKYGDRSLDLMFHKMIIQGAEIQNIMASVLGGSSMFLNSGHNFNIGDQNIEIALDFLKQRNINIKLLETGGNSGRRIAFHTDSGRIIIRRTGELKEFA